MFYKKISFFILGLLLSIGLLSQEKISKVKSHPYLFYTSENINRVKEKIRKDAAFSKSWQQMLKRADSILQIADKGDMEELSFVYRMTGEKKYAFRAKVLLQALLERNAWDELDNRAPRWNAGLGTARNNRMAAITFDAIYDILSPEEKKQMADRLVTLGIRPSLNDWTSADKRLHTLNSMGHNWWNVIVFDAGLAALAIMSEIPEAKRWAENAMQVSDEWFAFSGSILENKVSSFDPAGGFYESIDYANYGIGEYLFFRTAWTNAVGNIKKNYDPLLEKTMDWYINMSYPTKGQLQSVNFGDSHPFANGDKNIKLMMALGFFKKYYEWYLSKTNRFQIRDDLGIRDPLGLIYTPVLNNITANPNLPTAAIYENIGWASMRSSWQENATMLAVKSGYSWNHAHSDAGSFILYHNGKNLLIDGGNVDYTNPVYTSYFVQSQAHNVILFNGKAQDPQDPYSAVKTPGRLYNLMNAPNLKYILADATGPTARYFLRNYRNIVWVGNVILILDDLNAYEAGKFEWLLHTAVAAKKNGIDLEVKDDNAAVLVRPLFPATLPDGKSDDSKKAKLEEKQGFKDHDANTKVIYYSIAPPEETKRLKFITALILAGDKNKKPAEDVLPKIEKLEGNNFIGVRITEKGITTDLYFNLMADGRLMHRNSHNIINGWETDAYLLAMTYTEGSDPSLITNIDSWFVANGSYIRKDEKVILNSLSKVFLHADLRPQIPEILLQGQPLIRAEIYLNSQPANMNLNGKTIKLKFSNGRLQLRLGEQIPF